MIWEIALKSSNYEVINKSIALLVNCHLSFKPETNLDANSIIQDLIQ